MNILEDIMEFLRSVLEIMGAQGPTPGLFGWVHILSTVLSVALGIFLCIKFKNPTEKQVRAVLLTISEIMAL